MKINKPLKELLDSLKNIEGFPIGKYEDILALSDPPYYTACPNPYINDFIEEYGKPYDEKSDNYHREPFVADVSEGKNDPIYNAHSYHTKVPHKAIMKYIEHYTEEGDIVFDGFCGTGMTGVAAQLLGRRAILSDLSPIATFIAYNYNKKVDIAEFEKEAKRILKEVEEECGWMYETNHYNTFSKEFVGKGKINYTVWSDVFICPYCGSEIVFWDAAVDKEEGKVKSEFECPSCGATMKKTECKRATVTFFDKAIGKEVTQAKQVPVLINYTFGKKRYEKTPDEDDIALIKKIESMDIPYWFPTNKLPDGYNTAQPMKSHGITHVHHFYTKRNLWVLSCFWEKINKLTFRNKDVKNLLKLLISSYNLTHSTRMSRIIFKKNGNKPVLTGYQSGTLYQSSLPVEKNIVSGLVNMKLSLFVKAFIIDQNLVIISTNTSINNTSLIKLNSIDYIFTDPPFGDNLMYSELNFLWESWLKVFTNNRSEAIINKTQGKALEEYTELMEKSFKEYYRVLKPNRWMTVVFHNSKSAVWNAIQKAIHRAGFVIANVSVLDKKQGSFKQVTSAGAVKNDLVISAYKPKGELERKFLKNAGVGVEIDFVKMHLSNQPIEPTVERTRQMLYSRMLAYYVQHGYVIKYNSKSFYEMLKNNFEEVDGYWFTYDQISRYREFKKSSEQKDIKMNQLFIDNERAAIMWLYNFLKEPMDYSSIYTNFTRVVSTQSKDKIPELKKILEDNFIEENGLYRRPEAEETMRLEQKRERELLKDFENILFEAKTKKGKIKECRIEALKKGFEYCYSKGRFLDILTIAKKLDKSIIEEDADIQAYIDVAQAKSEGL